ncbi:hypothetical protein CYMTET_36520, partial [Cymbomonas tetramitiformis]
DNVVDHLIVLEGDGLVRGFDSTYSEYLEVGDELHGLRVITHVVILRVRLQLFYMNSLPKEDELAGCGGVAAHGGEAKGGSREARCARSQAAGGKGHVEALQAKPQQQKKLSYKEQKEYEGLEAEIEVLSTNKMELEAKIQAVGGDFEQLMKYTEELDATIEAIDIKSERWLELAELAE